MLINEIVIIPLKNGFYRAKIYKFNYKYAVCCSFMAKLDIETTSTVDLIVLK
jgi:hypothetical protein